MRLKNTLLTVLALCGASLLHGQITLSDLTSIDPTALSATQYSFSIAFGKGTVAPTNCPQQTSGQCAASQVIVIASGNRMVITNVSASMSFVNGTADVPQQCLSIELNLGTNIAASCLPFTQSQTVGASTFSYLNQNVHLFADGGVADFPQFLVNNLTGIGPIFNNGAGSLNVTIQGYLVKTGS